MPIVRLLNEFGNELANFLVASYWCQFFLNIDNWLSHRMPTNSRQPVRLPISDVGRQFYFFSKQSPWLATVIFSIPAWDSRLDGMSPSIKGAIRQKSGIPGIYGLLQHNSSHLRRNSCRRIAGHSPLMSYDLKYRREFPNSCGGSSLVVMSNKAKVPFI